MDWHDLMHDDSLTDTIVIPPLDLQAGLTLPHKARAILLAAYSFPAASLSPETMRIAEAFYRAGFGSFVFNPLTPDEYEGSTDVSETLFLTSRIEIAIDFVRTYPKTASLPVVLLGVGDGAAAGLMAAAYWPETISAVIYAGGWPDLSEEPLSSIMAPMLLIKSASRRGGCDLNLGLLERFSSETDIVTIPAAIDRFDVFSRHDELAHYTVNWLMRHIGKGKTTDTDRTDPK